VGRGRRCAEREPRVAQAPQTGVDLRVEGDDSRISWSDIYALFSRAELGYRLEPRFVVVRPSSKNEQPLRDPPQVITHRARQARAIP
jgi:hypothetical protein